MDRTWLKTLRATVGCIAVAVVATGCNNPFSSDDGTRVRLRNSSSFELTAVTFSPGQPQLKFDRIGPGETTNYASVANAYRYGYLDVLVGGTRRVLQPIDYVGENYIGEGRFTYVITVESTTRNPDVTLVKDD